MTCTGVHVCPYYDIQTCAGDTYAIIADETMLALGSVTTAQLLLVSGIGPAADLEELGIPVVADLPVGQTYQNHVFNGAMYCGPVNTLPTNGASYFPPNGLTKTTTTTFPTTTANVWTQVTSSSDNMNDCPVWQPGMLSNSND